MKLQIHQQKWAVITYYTSKWAWLKLTDPLMPAFLLKNKKGECLGSIRYGWSFEGASYKIACLACSVKTKCSIWKINPLIPLDCLYKANNWPSVWDSGGTWREAVCTMIFLSMVWQIWQSHCLQIKHRGILVCLQSWNWKLSRNETHKNQASVVSTYSIAFRFTDSILSSSPRDFS